MTKKVLFVTSHAKVNTFLYDMFNNDKELNNNYFIDGTVSTRDGCVEVVKEKGNIDLVIFFEKTPGFINISETMYQLRLSGCRVIYVSGDRQVGDLVLETIVGYGIYDIVLDSKITADDLISFIKNPRDFKDVAILHREVDIDDNDISKKGFKIMDIEQYKRFSDTLEVDYLLNKGFKTNKNKSPKIDNSEEDASLNNGFLKSRNILNEESEIKKRNKKRSKKSIFTKNKLGDM